jgi:hypothetical protein
VALEGTVKTPFGHMQKKTAVLVGGGGVVLAAIVYYRHQKSAQAAAAASTTNAATSAANDPNAIDPATGYPYGSAEDSAMLASQGGLNYSQYGTLGGGGTTGQFPQTGPPFSSNAAWAQYCEQTMGSSGSDAIAAALGHYLTGSPLQSGEPTIVDQAIAIGGYPPTSGPNGMPPGLNTNNPTSGQVKVPNVVGMETGAGDREITAAGLKFTHKTLNKEGSTITATSPSGGTMVAAGSTVNVTFKEKK